MPRTLLNYRNSQNISEACGRRFVVPNNTWSTYFEHKSTKDRQVVVKSYGYLPIPGTFDHFAFLVEDGPYFAYIHKDKDLEGILEVSNPLP